MTLLRSGLIVAFLLYASGAFAAIAIDSQESAGAGHRTNGTGTTLTLTWTFTNTAGTKLVGIFIASADTETVTLNTPSYNGVNMVLAGSQLAYDTNTTKIGLYYLDSPATGANTVSVNVTSSPASGHAFAVLGGVISFTGVATGVGTVTNGTQAGGTSVSAGSITTANGNYIFAGGSWGSGTGGTVGTGFTRTFLTNGSGNSAGDNILGEYEQSAGSSITPSFSWTGSDLGGIVAVELIASGGGGATCPGTLRLLGVGC